MEQFHCKPNIRWLSKTTIQREQREISLWRLDDDRRPRDTPHALRLYQ